jgi:hypothetical protein
MRRCIERAKLAATSLFKYLSFNSCYGWCFSRNKKKKKISRGTIIKIFSAEDQAKPKTCIKE